MIMPNVSLYELSGMVKLQRASLDLEESKSTMRSNAMYYERQNYYEPIISLDLFEQVRSAKAERTNIEMGEDGRKLRRSTKFTSQRTPDR